MFNTSLVAFAASVCLAISAVAKTATPTKGPTDLKAIIRELEKRGSTSRPTSLIRRIKSINNNSANEGSASSSRMGSGGLSLSGSQTYTGSGTLTLSGTELIRDSSTLAGGGLIPLAQTNPELSELPALTQERIGDATNSPSEQLAAPQNSSSPALYVEGNSLLDHTGAVGFKGASFSAPFTLPSTQKLVLRFVSDSPADAMILTEAEANKFRYGLKVKGYAMIEKKIGTQTAKLPAGTYYCAVRNRSQTANNNFRCEVDLELVPAGSTTFVDNPISDATYVKGGGLYTKAFVVQDGFRYFLDGCNLGVDSYILAESELSKFKSNQSFTASYASRSANGPGLWELSLEPGNYYLCFDNWQYGNTPVVYTLERWRDAAIKPKIALSGSHSWKVSGSNIELRVGTIGNTSNSNSGFLRVNLWATKAPYNGGAMGGTKIASSVVDPLASGAAYRNLVRVVPSTKPSKGKYYITLCLEEYVGTSWVQRDFYQFSGTTKF